MSLLSAATGADKGARYFHQLDVALCNGSWSEVPELARKTEKHWPQRAAYILAARAEAQIAHVLQRSGPTTPLSEQITGALGDIPSKLEEAIQKYPTDAYIGKICLAEIFWLQEKWAEALKTLPVPAGIQGGATGSLEIWEVKAELIRIVSLTALKRMDEAVQNCFLVASHTPGYRTPQLRLWTERLLGRLCTCVHECSSERTVQSLSESLYCFRAWSSFWQRASSASSAETAMLTKIDIPRRKVWRQYYALLSTILQHGLTYTDSNSYIALLALPSENSPANDVVEAKTRQRSAFKSVEVAYESLLLNETQFPKASQTNVEVEEWVHQVASNWKTFAGPGWPDAAFAGKERLGRGVLDILYRAATKTYHSTAILRYLFTVHASLGEFDLAMHAFKSYVEIIDKGRAGTRKTGKRGEGVDSDDTAILMAAEVVRILCRYGDRPEYEKALGVSKTIREWLDENHTASDDSQPLADRSTDFALTSKTKVAAYRAIGTSHSQWARVTYETHLRSELREQGMQNLRLAQNLNEQDVETVYALGLLLAENRDVATATTILKTAIASAESTDDAAEADLAEPPTFQRERQLLPVWHLLTLCLTAQDGYEQALRSCEAAFEQFGDPAIFYGDVPRASIDTHQHSIRDSAGSDLVDQLDFYEKETLLQIKITQLTLLELMQGGDAAVSASLELLGLFARLFGNPEIKRPVTTPQPPRTAASATPSKLGGTLRSIAGSIRPKSMRSSLERDPRMASTLSVPARRESASNSAQAAGQEDDAIGVPIAITVTNENGIHEEKSRHHHRHLAARLRGDHGSPKSSRSATNLGTVSEKSASPLVRNTVPDRLSSAPAQQNSSTNPERLHKEDSSHDHGSGVPDQPLEAVPHNAPHDAWPPPPGHEQQPPKQDVRLPAPHPSTHLIPDARLSTAQDQQQKTSLLVQVWLFVAGLYLRSDLLADASSAVNEASTLLENFEVEVGAEDSSARRFRSRAWGGGKSVDCLWGDVWSAKGYLALAHEHPFEALDDFEQALAFSPDHADGIVGLSNILMDIYEEKIPGEAPARPLAQSATDTAMPSAPQLAPNFTDSSSNTKEKKTATTTPQRVGYRGKLSRDLTPAELNRLAARDRAYMLLTNLTRLGSGWDNPEAWYTLARAHELSKQISKAKEALWWVVELEENEPVRAWRDVAPGGYTL